MDVKKAAEVAYFISRELREKGVDIWLEYGSALGAIRDGGVPDGDDDIDLALWQDDWKALEEIFGKPLPFPLRFKFVSCYSGGSYLSIEQHEGEVRLITNKTLKLSNLKALNFWYLNTQKSI